MKKHSLNSQWSSFLCQIKRVEPQDHGRSMVWFYHSETLQVDAGALGWADPRCVPIKDRAWAAHQALMLCFYLCCRACYYWKSLCHETRCRGIFREAWSLCNMEAKSALSQKEYEITNTKLGLEPWKGPRQARVLGAGASQASRSIRLRSTHNNDELPLCCLLVTILFIYFYHSLF